MPGLIQPPETEKLPSFMYHESQLGLNIHMNHAQIIQVLVAGKATVATHLDLCVSATFLLLLLHF